MSPLAAALPSPCCRADWATVNSGVVTSSEVVGVIACTTCATQYSLRVDLQLLAGPERGPRHGPNQSVGTVDQLVTRAHQLVTNGQPVLAACRTVGIDRTSYYRRHPPERRTA